MRCLLSDVRLSVPRVAEGAIDRFLRSEYRVKKTNAGREGIVMLFSCDRWWLRLVLPMLLGLLALFPETACCGRGGSLPAGEVPMNSQSSGRSGTDGASVAAKTGFVMDMAPLLGEHGRILAIAPGCRAATGIIDIFGPAMFMDLGITGTLFGIEGFVAKLISSSVVIILNYTCSKLLVFRNTSEN